MIKTEYWSHSDGIWIFYGKFENEDSFNSFIKELGYNPNYFRVAP